MKTIKVRKKESTKAKKLVWFNTPYHNKNDRYTIDWEQFKTGTEEEREQYTNSIIWTNPREFFNYGNEVSTSVIINCPINTLKTRPNYLHVYDNEDILESRWFVKQINFVDGDPNSKNPEKDPNLIVFTLELDSLVNYKEQLKTQLGKIRRGNLPRNQWSPILVQPEGLFVNEVKIDQLPIKTWDNDTQWLTIFYDQTVEASERTITFDLEATYVDFNFEDMSSDFSANGWQLSQQGLSNAEFGRTFGGITRTYAYRNHNNAFDEGFFSVSLNSAGLASWRDMTGITPTSISNDLNSRITNTNFTHALSAINGATNHTNAGYVNLRNRFDQRIIEKDSEKFRAHFSESSTSTYNTIQAPGNFLVLDSVVGTSLGGRVIRPVTTADWSYAINRQTDNINLFSVGFTILPTIGQLVLPGNLKLDEMNAGCLTIPFGKDVVVHYNDSPYELDPASILSIGTSGWTSVGKVIYDIQILPYCPMAQLNSLNLESQPSNNIDINQLTSSFIVPLTLKGSQTAQYYGLACTQASMDYRFPIDLSTYFGEDLKMDSITKKCRLMSHNHKAAFDFNPTLNNGVTALSFSYTIRPFDTTFRIRPVFNVNTLYGGNYQDVRGLVWQGGFSLSQVESEWINYKLQNSTYQQIFNSQIQNMEVANETSRALDTLQYETSFANAQTNIQKQRQAANIGLATGLASSGLSIATGVASSNPLAVAGGILSAGKAAGQYANAQGAIQASGEIAQRNLESSQKAQALNSSLDAENIQYKQDIFNLQMQAIEARPSTISSNSDYTIINTYKAYIEIYDCTDAEKENIENTLKYTGMKINQIGVIQAYIQNDFDYVEALLIQTPGLTPQVSNHINSELNSGKYFHLNVFDMRNINIKLEVSYENENVGTGSITSSLGNSPINMLSGQQISIFATRPYNGKLKTFRTSTNNGVSWIDVPEDSYMLGTSMISIIPNSDMIVRAVFTLA